ncbi:MAG TPA: RNA polymerase sigma factor [Polyangia bacterium]|nr:RNA polymerase sigma factor [Polyangia bacterium]
MIAWPARAAAAADTVALPIGTLLMSRWGAAGVGRPQPLAAVRTAGSDESLVARASGGDRQAFDDLYRRYVDLVWTRLGRLIGPDAEREDLLQHVFIEVFRSLPRFRGDASFRTFLYRIVLNVAADHLKRRRRRGNAPIAPEELDKLVDGHASPEARAAERQRLAVTFALLDRIKTKKRIAFLLRVVDGLSLEEIGELTGATAAAVAQRVRHANRELQALAARKDRR